MSGWPSDLFDHHKELLIARGINAQTAAARGYFSTQLGGWLRQQGLSIAASKRTPGLVVPVHDVHGGGPRFFQYRPDKPRLRDDKPVKYETPTRTRLCLDVPPPVSGKLADPRYPLWISESPLKADAGVSAGLVCVATFGTFGWRGSNNRGGKVALSDWEWIALNDRDIFLAPDSDVVTNPNVANAVARLGALLTGRGATVHYVFIPTPPDGRKLGLDDYLASGGTADELRDLADDEPPERPRRTSTSRAGADVITPSNEHATVQPLPPQLAQAPRILDLLAADVVALGVVGERNLAATTYLTLTSRLLDEQASLAVKGHTASGKSFVVEAVRRLFPPEAAVVFTAMSERALVYSDQQFSHRTLILYEAVALREGIEDNLTAYFVRSLLSKGRIEYPVTVRGKDGDYTTRTVVKEGPTNLVVTTTKVRVHAENESRLLSFTTDDSRAQTARVLAAHADEARARVDVDSWRGLQRWLSGAEHRVTVPYAGALARLIPPVAVRLRRDFPTLLALVRAHAMLHQLTRERDDDGRIVATLDDYDVVRCLVGDVLAEGVNATVSPVVRETVQLVVELDEAEGGNDHSTGITASTVAVWLKLDRSAAYRRLLAASSDGYLQNLEDRRGRPGRWRPAAPLPQDVRLLPECAAVAEALATDDEHGSPANAGTDAGGCTVASSPEGIKRRTTL